MGGVFTIHKEVTADAPTEVLDAVRAAVNGDPTGVVIVGENATPDNDNPVLAIMRDGVVVGALALAFLLERGVKWLYE